MTLLEKYEKEWDQVDPMDPRYDDKGCGVCPNERRFDRENGRNWLGDKGFMDQELDFN